jgi:hypothetical protein
MSISKQARWSACSREYSSNHCRIVEILSNLAVWSRRTTTSKYQSETANTQSPICVVAQINTPLPQTLKITTTTKRGLWVERETNKYLSPTTHHYTTSVTLQQLTSSHHHHRATYLFVGLVGLLFHSLSSPSFLLHVSRVLWLCAPVCLLPSRCSPFT